MRIIFSNWLSAALICVTGIAQAETPSRDMIRRMADSGNRANFYDDLLADRNSAILAIGDAIRSGDQKTKLYALKLAENEDFFSRDYYESIREFHRDPDQKIRYGIIGLLARYGDDGKKILLEMLADSTNDPNTRGVVLDFLNKVQTSDENATSARRILEKETGALLRLRAAQMLIHHGKHRELAAKAVRDCVQACVGTLKYEAVGLLGVIGTQDDLQSLKTLLDDKSDTPERLRKAARDAVRQLEWELLPTRDKKRERLKAVLSKSGSGKSWAIAMLDRMAKDGDSGASDYLNNIASDRSHPARDFARGRGYGQK